MEATSTTSVFTLPTWGQVKSLAAQGQIIVQQSGRLVTAEHLFLAMCALLSVSSVQGSAVSYWAYVPNPPMFEPVFWGDTDVLVYTTPSILSPPWNNLTYLNNFDGTPYNFTYVDKREPICFKNGPYFSMGFQHWSQPGIKIGRSHTHLQRCLAWSINQTWDNIIENYELAYPICPDFTYYGLKYRPFIWKTCWANLAK